MNRKKRNLAIVILMGLMTALALFSHRLSTLGDNLDYIAIASSVLRGEFWNPFLWRFPVGYPYFVTAILGITGFTPTPAFLLIPGAYIYVLKFAGILLVIPSLFLISKWFETVKSPYPLILTAFIATSQFFACPFSVISSEPLFIVFSVWACILWERAAATEDRTGRLLPLFLATFCSIQVRQIGMSIPIAAILLSLISGKWRDPFWRKCIWIGAVLPIILSLAGMLISNPDHLWALFSSDVVGDQSPADTFGTLERLKTNLCAYQDVAGSVLFQKVLDSNGLLHLAKADRLRMPLGLLASAVILYGAGRILFGRDKPGRFSLLYFLTSLVIIFIWPYQTGRFFIPLVPFGIWLAIMGILPVLRFIRVKSRWMPVILIALIAWQCATNTYAALKNLKNIWHWRQQSPWYHERYLPSSEQDYADLLECGEWLMAHSEPDAIVVSAKALYIQVSGKRPAYYPSRLDDILANAQPQQTPFYVIVDSFPDQSGYGRMKHEFILPVLENNKASFECVHVAPFLGASIYRYTPVAEP